jgi:hypothetical protein
MLICFLCSISEDHAHFLIFRLFIILIFNENKHKGHIT